MVEPLKAKWKRRQVCLVEANSNFFVCFLLKSFVDSFLFNVTACRIDFHVVGCN